MGDSGWEDGRQPLENIQIPTLIILLGHVYDDAQSAHGASYAKWHQYTKDHFIDTSRVFGRLQANHHYHQNHYYRPLRLKHR